MKLHIYFYYVQGRRILFAKIRGHLAWPATINGTYIKGKTIMYDFDFFGSKKEKEQCRVNELFSFN